MKYGSKIKSSAHRFLARQIEQWSSRLERIGFYANVKPSFHPRGSRPGAAHGSGRCWRARGHPPFNGYARSRVAVCRHDSANLY